MAWRNNARTVYCSRCYNTGHNKRGCPKNTPEQKERYKTGDRARVCSYCSQSGHNKTTCQTRKTHKAEYIKLNAKYRTDMLAQMVKEGIGVGALVKQGGYEANESAMALVTEIAWDNFQCKRPYDRVIYVRPLNEDDWVPSMGMPKNEYNESSYNQALILSGVPENVVRYGMPINWLDGTSNVDKFF